MSQKIQEDNYNFECPICLGWLRNPVITICGHHFCQDCLYSWLDKKESLCPACQAPLKKNKDTFLDANINRKIGALKVPCPNLQTGCNFQDSPHKMDKHLDTCPHRNDRKNKYCKFHTIGCDFSGSESDIESHNAENSDYHMNLLLEAYKNCKIASMDKWEARKPQCEADENIIKAMCDRIVTLEQRCIKLESFVFNNSPLDPRYSNGVLVWEVNAFSSTLEEMKTNISTLFYSRECYISPHGYKFCARINIWVDKETNIEFLSLHIHFMQSENDCHLEWPFTGRIKFSMIHPIDSQLNQNDTFMSSKDTLAFNRPKEKINSRGFGYHNYVKVSDIIGKDFVENDRLLLKIEVNVV